MAEFMTATSLENFMSVLRTHEIKTFSKFVCSSSEKSFTEAKFTPTERMKLHWNGDTPYFHIGRRVYACHQGKDQNLYQKKQYAEKRASKACEDYRARLTKKLDCPVVIHVSRLLTLPNFKAEKLTKYGKDKTADLIKSKIKKGEELAGEIVYRYKLPDRESHKNHVCGADEKVVSIHQAPITSTVEEMLPSSLLPEDAFKDPLPSPDKQNTQPTAFVFKLSTLKANNNNQKHSKNKTQLIRECNAVVRSLQSTMHFLEEKKLEQLRNNLNELQKDATLDCNVLSLIANTKLKILRKYIRLPKPKKKKAKKRRAAEDIEKETQDAVNSITATSECSLPPSNKKFKLNGKRSVHKKQMVFPENMVLGQSGSSQDMYSNNVIVLPENHQPTWDQNIVHLGAHVTIEHSGQVLFSDNSIVT